MHVWSPVSRPGSRSGRSWAFDTGVVFFVLLLWATYAFSASPSLPVWAPTAIVAAMTFPLVARRIWPVPVFGWLVLVAAATGWWAAQVIWSPALVVALYTVAALRPRREALLAAGVLAVGTVAASIRVFPNHWYLSAATLLAVVIAATVFGLYISTRHALLAELRDRAGSLERERDQHGELAAAAERQRIAREMHDVLAHHLTVMVALADGAAAQSSRAPQQAALVMQAVSSTGRSALADTRRLLGVLADGGSETDLASRSPLPGMGDLDGLVERVRTAGLPVRFEVVGAPAPLAPSVQLTLYRLIQEALTNTLKHAGPGCTASVRLHYTPPDVTVEVEDDGRAAPLSGSTDPRGQGLLGMRARVAAFGGEVHFGPRPPRGWRVAARLTVDPSGE